MSQTRFRFDLNEFKKKISGLAEITADKFRPDVMDFVRKSLQTASRNTPVRDYSLIRQNQIREYKKRVNCIPSSHELVDPSLRIDGRKHWLYYRGKWMNAKDWKLTDDAWAAYSQLMNEHERRKQTAQTAFIKERAQARFLYRRSWIGAADDLGIPLNLAQNTRTSRTRRKPQQEPQKSTASTRGGAKALSVQISNPFIDEPSRYKDFTGGPIIGAAMAKHEDQYKQSIRKRLKRIASAKAQ